MAIIKVRNPAIDLDAAEIPNLDASKITTGSLGADRIPGLAASKITSGTFADARIAASNVSQHATSFDDNKLVNDISTLALRQASDENKAGYNSNSMSVDVFQDSSKITNLTNAIRDANEYVSSGSKVLASSWSDAGMNNITGVSGTSTSTEDVFGGSNNALIGNLGTGGFLQQNDDNQNRVMIVETGVSGLEWGTDKQWRLLLSLKDPQSDGYAFSGILGGANHTNTSAVSNGTRRFISEGTGVDAQMDVATGNTGLSIFINTGYASGELKAKHADGDVSLSNAFGYTLSNQLVYFDYDGSANSNAGSLKLTLFQEGTSNALSSETELGHASDNGRTLPTSGRPLIMFGHHNNANSNPRLQVWTKTQVSNISATGSFEGTTVTAPSSVSSMGAIITYQNNAGTNALNTDIVLKLSADNGSNYSTATLTAMPDFSSGIKMAKVNDLSVTAGTQLKYKIEFANQSASKEARIRGVSLQY
jgi:hypothetical protein